MSDNIQKIKYDETPLSWEVNGRIRAHLEFLKVCLYGKKPLCIKPVQSILDVGCASGSLLLETPDSIRRVGVDIAPAQVARAREAGLEAEECDLESENLPFEDETFDVVCGFDIIEHVIHTDHLLNEMNRVLKMHGVLAASVPNIYQPASLLMWILGRPLMYAARYRGMHFRDFTPSLFKQILKKHGFQPLAHSGSFIFPFEASSWSHVLANTFPRLGAITQMGAIKRNRISVPEGISGNYRDLDRFLSRTDS